MSEDADLPEVAILDSESVTLAVSRDEHPESRVLLVDVKSPGGKVEMSELGIASQNVKRLAKQCARSVFQYRSKDGALWIRGDAKTWTLRIAVPPAPTHEVVLDEDQTRRLKLALFEPLPA